MQVTIADMNSSVDCIYKRKITTRDRAAVLESHWSAHELTPDFALYLSGMADKLTFLETPLSAKTCYQTNGNRSKFSPYSVCCHNEK